MSEVQTRMRVRVATETEAAERGSGQDPNYSDLTGGDVTTWQKVKRMVTATTPLFSRRIGLHHWTLFRCDSSELAVLTIIHR